MRYVGLAAAAAFLVLIVTGVFVWTAYPGSAGARFEHADGGDLALPLVAAALMIGGIVFGAVYAELQRPAATVPSAMRATFGQVGLYRALLVSPIVFAGVYAFAKANSDAIVIAIFAFQNGFFCESIFRKSAGTAGA